MRLQRISRYAIKEYIKKNIHKYIKKHEEGRRKKRKLRDRFFSRTSVSRHRWVDIPGRDPNRSENWSTPEEDIHKMQNV